MATLKTLIGGFAALTLLMGGAVALNTSGENIAHAQMPAAKAILNSAKARGEVGEQLSGYLGVVEGASPSKSVLNAMSEVNIARKSVYSRLAAQQNVPIDVVAQITGEKQIKKAASGHFVKDATDAWKRK